MSVRKEIIGDCELWLADCRDVLPTLGEIENAARREHEAEVHCARDVGAAQGRDQSSLHQRDGITSRDGDEIFCHPSRFSESAPEAWNCSQVAGAARPNEWSFQRRNAKHNLQEINREDRLREMWRNGSTLHSSQGRKSPEQRSEKSGSALQSVPQQPSQTSMVERPEVCLITDPPYGMQWDGKVTVGKNGHGKTGSKAKHYGVEICGDRDCFDASPWLKFPNCILWGFNHFPEQLRKGRALVWIKRLDSAFGSFLSDAELAWCSIGHGVYCFRDQSLMSETKYRCHPTQKPVPLMCWCIEQFPNAGLVFDPFMGSGTTGVACVKLGRRFIGVEIEERYFDIACRRIEEAYRQGDMFRDQPRAKPVQESMAI